MSKAYQCDRCGMLFIERASLYNNVYIKNVSDIDKDLCPECVKSFNRWWNQEEEDG